MYWLPLKYYYYDRLEFPLFSLGTYQRFYPWNLSAILSIDLHRPLLWGSLEEKLPVVLRLQTSAACVARGAGNWYLAISRSQVCLKVIKWSKCYLDPLLIVCTDSAISGFYLRMEKQLSLFSRAQSEALWQSCSADLFWSCSSTRICTWRVQMDI